MAHNIGVIKYINQTGSKYIQQLEYGYIGDNSLRTSTSDTTNITLINININGHFYYEDWNPAKF